MICEASSLKKYIDKSSNIFFVFGSEIVLRNSSVDHINQFFKSTGYSEKKAIHEKDFINIEKIVVILNILENVNSLLNNEKDVLEAIKKLKNQNTQLSKKIDNISSELSLA